MKNGFIKKADIVLFVVLLVLGIGSTLLLGVFGSKGAEDALVEVSVNGEVVRTAQLNKDQTIEIDNEYGRNLIVIEGGRVFVKEADCGGGDCIKMGEISKGGQAIMCLPHRLIVTIVKGGGLDATAY